MAQASTLARPYARAAFEVAGADASWPQWSEQLAIAAAVVRDKTVAAALSEPSNTAAMMAATVIEVCADALTEPLRRFVRVLADNKRLALLPEIYSLFEQYRANREKTVEVELISAFDLKRATLQTLARVLGKKLQREVKIGTTVDRRLLGGALIRAGDLVIDGSVRGRLNKLAAAMNLQD